MAIQDDQISAVHYVKSSPDLYQAYSRDRVIDTLSVSCNGLFAQSD